MTGALLAALSVGGLLIGFLLLYVRFARIEELLSRLQEIQSLSEEIRELRKTMSALSFAGLEENVEGVREHNRRIEAILDHSLRQLVELNGNFGQRRSHAVRDLIERKFFSQGYETVVVLSDLEGDLEEPLTVMVEALRGGISFKGSVVVQNETVVEANLKPSYEVFP